jgi:hypothetical protein
VTQDSKPQTGVVVEDGVGETETETDGDPQAAASGDVTPGDPSKIGGGPGGPSELAGADALGGSDCDIGRGAD